MMKYIRRFKDLGIEGNSARWYDKNSRMHRIPEMKSYASEVAELIGEGSSVLEIAPGPGYLSIELAKLGDYKIVGLDISQDFVRIAQANAQRAGVEIAFFQGNAAALPFEADSFDFAVCTAAFKNFKKPLTALFEMYKVLKPGGRALIIDMNKNASDWQFEENIRNSGLKGGQAVWMKMIFKYFLKKGAYSHKDMSELIDATPFLHHEIKEKGIAIYVYLQK
jgi:ubiquinone/menaquinone biosynthesis C-methylase UbiE